jgi:hypothetical protein
LRFVLGSLEVKEHTREEVQVSTLHRSGKPMLAVNHEIFFCACRGIIALSYGQNTKLEPVKFSRNFSRTGPR